MGKKVIITKQATEGISWAHVHGYSPREVVVITRAQDCQRLLGMVIDPDDVVVLRHPEHFHWIMDFIKTRRRPLI